MNYNNNNISKNKIVKKYGHLTLRDRMNIDNMFNSKTDKFTLENIANKIGVDKATIHREICRNGTLRAHSGRSNKKGYRRYKYTAQKAHKLALTRTKQAKHTTKFAYFIEWVNKNIEYDDSMYTIREKFIKNNPDENVPCETTLYYWWHLGVVKYSTRRKPRKKRTNNSKNLKTVDTPKVSIEQRPEIVSKKIEFGHWEIDTVYDGDKKGGLLTLNEIKTCKYYTLKIADRRAFTVMTKLIELINQIGKENFKSITSDNGNEFAYFNRINNLFKISWYFCHPYSSWERGQNEHLNGEMRFYFPKGTLFHNKSEETIYQKCDRINNKPRRIHGGLSSNELFNLELQITKTS